MDNTLQNIKMCEKAEEIQDIFLQKLETRAWEYNHIAVIWGRKDTGGLAGTLLTMEPVYGLSWEDGEYIIYNGKIQGRHHRHSLSEEDPKAKVVWLPRQDQLQEMSGLTWHDFDSLCWAMAWEDGKAKHIPSKEIAGVMALMNHKHNKIWNGEEWVIDG